MKMKPIVVISSLVGLVAAIGNVSGEILNAPPVDPSPVETSPVSDSSRGYSTY